MRQKERLLRETLKSKGLVYLHSTMSGPGMSKPCRMWAIDIDPTYPWAGGWTYRREDASAFTVAAAKAINDQYGKSGISKGGYDQEPAADDHSGTIYYLPHEIM